MRKTSTYACYKDDKFICMGTLKEIANYIGITYDSLLCAKSRNIYIFVKVDDQYD